MNLRRKVLLGLGALAVSPKGMTQGKALRIIVPFPAGGGTDVLARIVGEKLRGGYASTVIVENRVGASGRIGVEAVKNADPDGGTLLFIPDFLLTVFPHSFRKLSYDPVADFAPVAMVARAGLAICAGPALPDSVRTISQYLDWVRSAPKNAFYATTSAGGTPHFVGVMLAKAAGAELSPVHYKGGAPALQDLLGGQVQLMFDNLPPSLPQIKAGKLRALGVTSTTRAPALPEVPTIAESGLPGFDASSWFGLLAPAGTSPAIIAKINAEIAKWLATPEAKEKLLAAGANAAGGTPEDFARHIAAETAKWAKVVKESGAKVD
jgi:tripartite-type tricarboxylate transporter receptor subunit TctC